ncbi:MAG: hypothetical protein FWH10_06500 [Oscillospiraceae bacterium]|nr:hypothetical protein [Oscillospiraceae bacterium]
MIFTWLALLIGGLVCSVFKNEIWFTENMNAVSWVIIAATSVVFLIDAALAGKGGQVSLFFAAGYLMRILLLFWDRYYSHIFILPNSGKDSEGFYAAAVSIYSGNYVRYTAYPDFINDYIFRFFGPQRIIAQYVNILLGIAAVSIGLRILRKFNADSRTQTIFAAVGMLMPNYAVTNSILLRESIIVFLLALSSLFFVKWLKEGKILMLIIAAAFSLNAATFHSGAIALAVAYAVCLILYDRRSGKFRFTGKTIIFSVLCVFAYFFISDILGYADMGKFGRVESVEDVAAVGERESRGGSGYGVLHINTGSGILDMAVNSPFRIFYFILSPLPWDWRGMSDIIAFVFNALFYAYCYYKAYKTLTDPLAKNKQMIISLLVAAVVSAFVFSWGVDNAGTALRHRDKFFIQYLLIFALCLKNKFYVITGGRETQK